MKVNRKMLLTGAWSGMMLIAATTFRCSSSDSPKSFDCDESDLEVGMQSKSNLTTCAAADGSITVVAAGGEEPYTYSADGEDFQASATFDGLGAGTYRIQVKDKRGCVRLSESIELTVPGLEFTAEAVAVDNTGCLTSESNGSITVNVEGVGGPFQYKLGGGAYSAANVFGDLNDGVYQIKVKNAEGCELSLSVEVDQGITGVNYVNDIRPLFIQECENAGCHPANGDWFTYATAKANAATIKALTQSGAMPKNGTLDATQKAMIACWVDDGAPEN
jgi:hypothetical protein